jgi:ribokinase
VVVPGANGKLTPQLLEGAADLLRGAGFLLAQLEIPLETVESLAQFAERHNIPFMLDPAPARTLPAALLRRVSWLTPNETETAELLKTSLLADGDGLAAADRFLAAGVENVLLKLGSQGCVVAQRSQPKVRIPAFSVDAVDTTAAGDAFNAGFAVSVLRGYSISRTAVFASAVAAISVTRPGAQTSMPTGNEVEDFLDRQPMAITRLP